MRQTLVAGNWKMNGSRGQAAALAQTIEVGSARLPGIEIILCPPFVYLHTVGDHIGASSVRLGAQNLAYEAPGAVTGEIAGTMLVDMGCAYVLVGHSERRVLSGETDALVARRFQRALDDGLTPVLCVGETLDEREAQRTQEVVARQLDAILDSAGIEGVARAVIAYEPVWAINTGRTASPAQANEVHAFIRERLAARDTGVAAGVQILYGGSVGPDTAAGLFAEEHIDGGLIGKASLDAEAFLSICEVAVG